MIRKASQFWIEDPLRKVNQPVLFITQAGSEADITGKDGLGAMFVRSARTINSGDLPLFKHYAVNADGVKFTYTRIFDKESVLIEVPHRLVVSVGKKLSRWYTVTKLRPAFEISDDSGDITGIIVCDEDNWTTSGKYYAIDKNSVDPFEYGNWMCHYDEKPFSGDLENKVIRRDGRVTITDIAPCGYHGVIVGHDNVLYSGEANSGPGWVNWDISMYLTQSLCVLNDTIDSGTITLTGNTYTIHDIVDSMAALNATYPVYNPNWLDVTRLIPYYNVKFSVFNYDTDVSGNEGDTFSYPTAVFGEEEDAISYTTLTSNICDSSEICRLIDLSGYGVSTDYWQKVDNIFLYSPMVSNYYSESLWSFIYVSNRDCYYRHAELFTGNEIVRTDTTENLYINIVVSGSIFSSSELINTLLYTYGSGDSETMHRAVFYSPVLSNLRTYLHNGVTYVIGALMELECIEGYSDTSTPVTIANSTPKITYFIVRTGDDKIQTLSLDGLYTTESVPYSQLDDEGNRLCYGKFRLIEIEEKVEVEDI